MNNCKWVTGHNQCDDCVSHYNYWHWVKLFCESILDDTHRVQYSQLPTFRDNQQGSCRYVVKSRKFWITLVHQYFQSFVKSHHTFSIYSNFSYIVTTEDCCDEDGSSEIELSRRRERGGSGGGGSGEGAGEEVVAGVEGDEWAGLGGAVTGAQDTAPGDWLPLEVPPVTK